MREAEYHARPAMSSSRLKAATTGTMRDYWARFEDPSRQPFEPTDAMRQGSLVDCLLTQPAEFENRYHVAPKLDRRTREGKAAWEELEAIRATGRETISQDWLDNAVRICATLGEANPWAARILDAASDTSQTPHFWRDGHGQEHRYLPDIETTDGGLWDLKKARSAEPRRAAAQAYALAYDVQLAHYVEGFTHRHGRPPSEVGLILYEWEWPHNCSVMLATPEFLQLGARRRQEALSRIATCKRQGIWSSWPDSPLDVPRWLQEGKPVDSFNPDTIEGF